MCLFAGWMYAFRHSLGLAKQVNRLNAVTADIAQRIKRERLLQIFVCMAHLSVFAVFFLFLK